MVITRRARSLLFIIMYYENELAKKNPKSPVLHTYYLNAYIYDIAQVRCATSRREIKRGEYNIA